MSNTYRGLLYPIVDDGVPWIPTAEDLAVSQVIKLPCPWFWIGDEVMWLDNDTAYIGTIIGVYEGYCRCRANEDSTGRTWAPGSGPIYRIEDERIATL